MDTPDRPRAGAAGAAAAGFEVLICSGVLGGDSCGGRALRVGVRRLVCSSARGLRPCGFGSAGFPLVFGGFGGWIRLIGGGLRRMHLVCD